MKMPDIKIIVACHKPTVLPKCDLFVPIQPGAALTDFHMDMLQDNTGDNISEKNAQYCELTAQYWAWKNIDADYYGLCHYRRFFSFAEEPLDLSIWGTHEYDVLSAGVQQALCLDSESIRRKLSQADLIVGTSADLKKLNIDNLYAQYESAPELHIEDLNLAIRILKETYPEYTAAADTYMSGQVFYPCNMFIMKRDLFFEYSSWLFDILGRLEVQLNMEDYSVEGKRTIGHIAERLLGIYFTKKHLDGIKTAVLPWAIVRHTDPITYPAPAFADNNIPVVFSSSNYYVPYTSVTIQSLLEHTDSRNNYDIIILHTNITDINQQHLHALTHGYHNVSMRFLNIIELTDDLRWIANNHISAESFYRLYIPALFREYERIIYLDCDLIVLHDVAELFQIDMGDAIVAATVDADHAGQYGCNYNNVIAYSDTVLRMEKPYDYFQAGVLLFSVRAFNQSMDLEALINYAQEREYMYMDQDILNARFQGRVKFVPMQWNVMTNTYQFRMDKLIRRSAPERIWKAYLEARQDPFIVHFAGGDKPWINPETDMAFLFWEYARNNPFYEIILYRMHCDAYEGNSKQINKRLNELNEELHLPYAKRVVNVVLPKNTHRREVVKKAYHKTKDLFGKQGNE